MDRRRPGRRRRLEQFHAGAVDCGGGDDREDAAQRRRSAPPERRRDEQGVTDGVEHSVGDRDAAPAAEGDERRGEDRAGNQYDGAGVAGNEEADAAGDD